MSDNIEEEQQQNQTDQQEQPATMTETEKSQVTDETHKKPTSISFSIWPPTQRTRDSVIHRLIESLSTPSILSKRYGTFPHDEASEVARRIEDEAFAVAGSSSSGDDDGLEILQVYSKEISKRMLDAVKARSAVAVTDTPAAEAESKPSESPEKASDPSGGTVRTEDEVSSVETES